METKNLAAFAIIVIIMALCVSFCSSKEPEPYCERCILMEKYIRHILYDVEEHDPDFVMDVLCETDDWEALEDLIGPINPPIIKDSVYRKLRNVFPDLPAKQAPQWK